MKVPAWQPQGRPRAGLHQGIIKVLNPFEKVLRGSYRAGRVHEVVQLLGKEVAAHERLQLGQAQLRHVRQARARSHERPVVGLRHALRGARAAPSAPYTLKPRDGRRVVHRR